MWKYQPGDDCGPLELWSFDNPASNYRITSGAPQSHGRIHSGGPGHRTRYGIWHCEEGTFDCTEQGDELMTILSGRCRITCHASGKVHDLGPGDTLFVQDGSRVTWQVQEAMTKVFFGYKAEGY